MPSAGTPLSCLALDPGSTQTGWIVLREGMPVRFGKDDNAVVRRWCEDAQTWGVDAVVIEMFACYGMPIGAESIQTVLWIGRFYETLLRCNIPESDIKLVTRMEIKLHHCHNARANDATVRQALIDRFGPGKEKAVGTKAAPGPLYRVRADVWSALALGTWWWDRNKPAGYRTGEG
jgi:hypothetical protein